MEIFKQKDLVDEMIESINKQKIDFVKKKFIEKGYSDLVQYLDSEVRTRFPKINISLGSDGFEYYFADNGTTDGDFIVAVKWATNCIPAFTKCSYTSMAIQLAWQDNNFDTAQISKVKATLMPIK